MKILYVYNKMPDDYQKYLNNFLNYISNKLEVKTLVYEKNISANYYVKTYGFLSRVQYFLFKSGLSKFKKLDNKYMYNFDIVHLQYSYLWRKLENIKSKKNRPKIIITLRGGDTFVKPWLSEEWRNFYRSSIYIDAFVVMSEVQKKYLLKWGVPETKIYIIPISFGFFSNSKPKYPNQRIMKLVSAYRMTWEKNITGTINFARILKEKNIDFEYDIYGDGSDLGQLYYLIDRFGLNNYVNVKGKVDNDFLKKNLVNYDFFVQLSISDALPTSVIEAQSLGLPCIVSNVGGLPEAVKNNSSGIVSDFNNLDKIVDQTINLWRDNNKYFNFSEEAINHANKNFSMEVEFEKLKNLYINILEK